MSGSVRKTGIKVLGDVPWGTHFCQFYQDKKDLLDLLIPYFRAGLENNEFCMWICSEPLSAEEAASALRKAVPKLDAWLKKGAIEFHSYADWYLSSGEFRPETVLKGWADKMESAAARGFDGLRIAGNTLWLQQRDWADFAAYEEAVNSVLSRSRIIALCTYSLDLCGVRTVIDVIRNHQSTLIRQAGEWTMVTSTVWRGADEAPAVPRDELERLVLERTRDLAAAVDKAKREAKERRRAEKALSQTSRILEGFFASTISPMAILDKDLNFVRVNESYARSSGRALSDFPGRSHFELFPDPENEAIFRKVVESREPYRTQARPYVSPDHPERGTTYWDWSLSPVLDRTGNVEFLVFSPEDVTDRRKNEISLAEQAALLDLAHDAILVCALDGAIQSWSHGAETAYGWTREEAMGRKSQDLLKSAFPEPLDRIIEKIIRTGRWEGEIIQSNKRGDKLIVSSRWALKVDEAGRPAGILKINIDVTESKKGEQALLASSRYTRSLIEASLDPLVTISSEGKITDVNRATELVTGFPRTELIGRDFSDFFTDPLKARTGYQMAFSRGEVRDYPLAIRNASGGVTFVVYNASVYRNEAGEVQGVFAAARDITERKKAEEESLRLAKALEQTAEGIVILDIDQEITFVNPAFEKISGLRAQDVMRSTYLDILRTAGVEDALQMKVKEALDRREGWLGHMIRNRPGVGPYEVDAAISPVFDEAGGLKNFMAIERDVTDEVRLQENIRQGQKMEALGTLAGGIAHDFNNILMPILINAEMSILDEPEDGPNAKRLTLVLEAARRGKDLVKQIISFSRRKAQEKSPVKVGPVIKEGLILLRASLPKNIEIVEEIGTESAGVLADPTQIHQVLINLCSNAAYAMRKDGGILTVRLSEAEVGPGVTAKYLDLKPGPYLELTVRDMGVGMTPDVRRKAFDPFFTTKAPGEGSGIGLSVVHGIVKDLGGAIDLESELGKGSTFTIFLPRLRSGEAAEAKASGPPPRGTGRILFVDDEEINLKSVPPILEHLGYEVVGLTDAKEALKLFRERPEAFDAVITDQMMPSMTGEILAAEMRRTRPDLPIVLCTGFSETIDEERAKALGIGVFLMKPFSMKEIADAIRDVLKPSG